MAVVVTGSSSQIRLRCFGGKTDFTAIDLLHSRL
jgi:hypothetical protein